MTKNQKRSYQNLWWAAIGLGIAARKNCKDIKIQVRLQKGFGLIVRLRSKRPTNIFGRQFKMVLTLCVWYSGFLQTRQSVQVFKYFFKYISTIEYLLPWHFSEIIELTQVRKSQKHYFLNSIARKPNEIYLTKFCPSFIGQNFV